MKIFSSLACMLAIAPWFAAGADEPVNMDEVIAAWQKRQDAVKNFRCEFSRSYFYPRGSLSRTINEGPMTVMRKKMNKKATQSSIAESTESRGTAQYLAEVSLNGFRFEFDQISITKDAQIESRRVLLTEASETRKRLDTNNQGIANGRIELIAEASEATMWEFQPIMLALRGNNRKYSSLKLSEWKPGGQRIIVDGVEAVLFVPSRSSSSVQRDELWLAPEQGWLPVKKLTVFDSDHTVLCQYTNHAHNTLGWVPKSWSTTSYTGNPRRLKSTSHFTVLSLDTSSLDNSMPRPVIFPAGTPVEVEEKGSFKRYIAAANGDLIDPIAKQSGFKLAELKWQAILLSCIVVLLIIISLCVLRGRWRRVLHY